MGLFGFCHFPESFLPKCHENQLWLVPNIKLASSHVSSPPFPRAYVNSKLEPLPTAGEGQEVAALQPDKALGAWEEKVPKGKHHDKLNPSNSPK